VLLALLALGAAAGALIPPGIVGGGPTPLPAVTAAPRSPAAAIAPRGPQGMSTTRQVGPASARIISSSRTSTTTSPAARSAAATPG
jgi:hypothetical protein